MKIIGQLWEITAWSGMYRLNNSLQWFQESLRIVIQPHWWYCSGSNGTISEEWFINGWPGSSLLWFQSALLQFSLRSNWIIYRVMSEIMHGISACLYSTDNLLKTLSQSVSGSGGWEMHATDSDVSSESVRGRLRFLSVSQRTACSTGH